MNKLDRPAYDDEAALDALANSVRTSSYPTLQPHVAALKAGYAQYVAAAGDVTAVAAVILPGPTAQHLRGHYKKPPVALAHINVMRDNSSAKTCSMCGSLHSGTLDHLMDKYSYPAFAVFSQNLVPACICNSKRPAALVGPNPGERILHPYFDTVLAERIVAARFTDLGPVPHIETRLLIAPGHPDYAAVAFHHDSVIMNTALHGYLKDMWVKLLQRPDSVVADLRVNPSTKQELVAFIEDQRGRVDYQRSSRNNWDSIFLSGLLEPEVIVWLYARLTILGRLPNAPLL